MLTALKNWVETRPFESPFMEPGDWLRVRAVSVCIMNVQMFEDDPARRRRILLEADVPERPRLFFAQKEEPSGVIRFGLNHR
jgi:hypothetical protein